MIVLYYIKNTSCRYCTFVSNRVTEIRNHTLPEQWNHIDGSSNPADVISRGSRYNEEFRDIWIDGPLFLRRPADTWPDQPSELQVDQGLIELKKSKAFVLNTVVTSLSRLITYHASWTKTIRVVAWITRFKTYIQVMFGKTREHSINVGLPKLSEIKQAKLDVVKLIQMESFHDEWNILQSHQGSLLKSSRLFKLNPIIMNGVICVNSRLANSQFSTNFRFPMIIPNDHVLTPVLINHYHEVEGHCGTLHTLNSLRNEFWIIKGQRTVRNVLS